MALASLMKIPEKRGGGLTFTAVYRDFVAQACRVDIRVDAYPWRGRQYNLAFTLGGMERTLPCCYWFGVT
jgi:hypothetical protein